MDDERLEESDNGTDRDFASDGEISDTGFY